MKRVLAKILFSLCVVVFGLNAASANTLHIATENEEEKLNPIFSEDHDNAFGLLFSGLVRFDEKMQPLPDLAESWSVSKDGLVYDFELKKNISWHDGAKFSARDVKFTIESIMNEKVNSPLRPNFSLVKSVEVRGDYAVRVTLAKPYPALLDSLSVGVIPFHLLNGKDLNTAKFNQQPVGTGPYKLVRYKKGVRKEFKANENFYLGKVQTPNLILQTIPNPNTAALALKSGKLDAALVSFEFAKNFENDKKFNLFVEKSADYRALMFNFHNEFLKEKLVRQALIHAVDRELLVSTLLHDLGFVAHHPLQNSWAAPEKFAKFEFDPNKTHKLLAKAGFKCNAKGIYERDGRELSFEIYAMSNDPLRVAMTQFLVSEFKKVGVNAKGVAKNAGTFDYSAVDSFVVGWGSPLDPDMHTFRVFGNFGEESDFNLNHYADKKVSHFLQKARETRDEKKRKEYYAKFINALYENPPFLFISYINYPLVVSKRVTGVKHYTLGHHGVGFLANAWEWKKN